MQYVVGQGFLQPCKLDDTDTLGLRARVSKSKVGSDKMRFSVELGLKGDFTLCDVYAINSVYEYEFTSLGSLENVHCLNRNAYNLINSVTYFITGYVYYLYEKEALIIRPNFAISIVNPNAHCCKIGNKEYVSMLKVSKMPKELNLDVTYYIEDDIVYVPEAVYKELESKIENLFTTQLGKIGYNVTKTVWEKACKRTS